MLLLAGEDNGPHAFERVHSVIVVIAAIFTLCEPVAVPGLRVLFCLRFLSTRRVELS